MHSLILPAFKPKKPLVNVCYFASGEDIRDSVFKVFRSFFVTGFFFLGGGVSFSHLIIGPQYLLFISLNEQDRMIKKEISVCQQTQALLYKNLLKKWRMKKESLLVWFTNI